MDNKESLLKVKEYITNLKTTELKDKTEHSDRTNLENLLNKLKPSSYITIQHEPKRSKEGFGSPDYVVKINESIVGYIEVKKIEQNLDETLKSEQIKKYKELSENIILTNYIEFVLIRSKEVIEREVLIFKSDFEKIYHLSKKINIFKIN
ncbi:type I restriction endonuclease [Borreliella afzelii]|uniref:type I restriction endonuclease n=1 Tax=Borreliella afzelii TaxID=29518 RepID=UPI00359C78C2